MKFTKVPVVCLYRITDTDESTVILSHEEALELYDLLGKALSMVTNVEVPTMTPKAIEWAKCGDWDGKLRAIKEVRARNNCTLMEAKECVLKYMLDNNIPTP